MDKKKQALTEYSQSNFQIATQPNDFYTAIQRNVKRVGEIGDDTGDAYKDRAYEQFKQHDFETLAKIQDKFIHPDGSQGTPGKENNRNVKRMEYDLPVERNDGKEHEHVLGEVFDKVELTVDKILNAFRDQGYTINTAPLAIGTDPVQKEDYDGQTKI